ncbi:MAG: galactose-1-epimerase, partial [Sphingobacteriaceae bacterium]
MIIYVETGKITPVNGTAFDFTTAKTIGKNIDDKEEQLKFGKGYDHNFALNPHDGNKAIAKVKSTLTGIILEVYTTEPG